VSDTDKNNLPPREMSEVKKGEGVTCVPLESSPIRQPRYDGAGVTVAPLPVQPQAPAASTALAAPKRVLTESAPRPTKGSDGP
jgi:hypothetical protein